MAEKKQTKKRMAITTDLYDREVFDGIVALAKKNQKKTSRYVRDILTNHYKRNKGSLE